MLDAQAVSELENHIRGACDGDSRGALHLACHGQQLALGHLDDAVPAGLARCHILSAEMPLGTTQHLQRAMVVWLKSWATWRNDI